MLSLVWVFFEKNSCINYILEWSSIGLLKLVNYASCFNIAVNELLYSCRLEVLCVTTMLAFGLIRIEQPNETAGLHQESARATATAALLA